MDDHFLINDEVEFNYTARSLRNLQTGKEVILTQIVCNLLLCLCQHNDEVVQYSSLMEEVWGERHKNVQYGTVYQTVLLLRKAIRKLELQSKLIKTIPRKGIMLSCRLHSECSPRNTDNDDIKEGENGKEYADVPLIQENRTFPWIKTLIRDDRFVLLMSMIFFIVSSMLYIFKNNPMPETDFFSGFQEAGTLKNDCAYSFNSDTHDYSQHKQFIRDHASLCLPNTHLFISTEVNNPMLSAIRCNIDLTSRKKFKNCVSIYFPNYIPKAHNLS